MNKTVPKNAAIFNCGNCGSGIDLNGQYCAGCGQPLWHSCVCGTRALLTQPFCDSCGANLHEKFQTRRNHFQNIVTRCEELRHRGKYQEAIHMAQGACKAPDYRFQDLAEQAQRHVAEMSAEIEHWAAEIDQLQPRIDRYLDECRYEDVVALLSPIPIGAMPGELAAVLESCRAKAASVSAHRAELEQALQGKHYHLALTCLTRLLELKPNDAKYHALTKQLTSKVLERATQYRQKLQFSKAIELLHCVPWHCQDSKYLNLLAACEETVLLRQLVAKSVFMEPTLAAVLDRLQQVTGTDPSIEKLRQRQQAIGRQANTSGLWPEWTKPGTTILGVAIKPMGLPSSGFGALPKCMLERGSQFWVALGLAIQAARNLMPAGDLLQDSRSKGVIGMLAGGGSKTRRVGWGIDIGDSSIKAVKIRYANDGVAPQVEFARLIEFDFKAGAQRTPPKEAIVSGLAKLLSEVQLSGERVFVNYPASELISRYLSLPPHAAPNKLRDFLMQDAQAHIPIDLKSLLTAYHISNYSKQDSSSPSAVLVATRKLELELRKAVVESAGLKISGILPEPFAMWNAWQTILQSIKPGSSANPQETSSPEDSYAADLLVDVGRNRTNLVICHSKGLWQRTIDWGTESLNTALAKKLQLTQSEADVLRRAPLRAKQLQPLIEAMQLACQGPKREFERSDYVARETIASSRLRRAVLVGGGAYQPFIGSWFNGADFLQSLGPTRPNAAPETAANS